MRVFVKDILGKKFEVDVEPSDTIDILKSELYKKYDIRQASWSYIYAGNMLTSEKSLFEFGVMKDSNIHQVYPSHEHPKSLSKTVDLISSKSEEKMLRDWVAHHKEVTKAMTLIEKPEIQSYLANKKQHASKQDAKTKETIKEKPEIVDSDNLCKICYDKEINTVLIPCGHICACKECCDSSLSKPKTPCPICRVEIDRVLHTFRA